MDATSRRPKRRDGILSSLNAAIDAMNIAKDVMDLAPAKAVFASVSVILTMIKVHFLRLRMCCHSCTQDTMVNEMDYVDLGLACADVCRALDRGMGGRRMDELSESVVGAIGQLTM